MPAEHSARAGESMLDASGARRVLFICADAVGAKMAGLGIRCWELARALSPQASVTVAHGGSTAGEHEGIVLIPYRPHAPRPLRALIAGADMVVAHPQWPLVGRWLRHAPGRVVMDLYCPETFETLELLRGRARFDRRQRTATTIDRLQAALRTGHNFVCASETQRDLWLGAMLALRLIDPETYAEDPSFRGVIDLVPFGVPEHPPRAPAGGGPRAAIAALDPACEIVLWNGGIWSWLDAETAIRAVGELSQRRPSARLVFMGASGDNPAGAASTEAARGLAHELGLLDSIVHFHDGWVPYEERASWLTQAACAISTHTDSLETHFAYRTRLLDCFWAGLPVVCTSGDAIAERVAREELGATAPPGDVEALSVSLERVLERGRDAYSERLEAAAAAQTWPRVVAPLARWLSMGPPAKRPGDASQASGRPLAQRAREAAYLAGGRALLARR